jgi:hypothetical protein
MNAATVPGVPSPTRCSAPEERPPPALSELLPLAELACPPRRPESSLLFFGGILDNYYL